MINLRNKLSGLRALWSFDNRWQLIINRTLFPGETLLTYRKGSLEFVVDHAAGDHNGTRLCLISDIYTRFLPLMDLSETISVLDLGANGGGFPLMLHLRGKKFSRLVCVEMNPNTFQRLKYNIGRNIEDDITLIQAAICGRSRRLELQFGRGDISDTIYQDSVRPIAGPSRTYVVDGRTFDEVFRSQFGDRVIDLCKMDIEGAEYEVFASSEHDCLRLCRNLLIELHPGDAQDEACLHRELSTLGFAPVEIKTNDGSNERLYRNTKIVSRSG